LDIFLENQSIHQDDAPVGTRERRVWSSSGISCQAEDNSSNVQDGSVIRHRICHKQVVASYFEIYTNESIGA
jgi:hypothetical protein